MASFIIGFLGTAGPRLTSAPHFTRTEVLVLVTLDLFAAGLHFGGSHRAADLLFVLCLVSFAFILGKRFAQRADSPPPNFVLVALGLLNGVIGALLLALYQNQLYAAPYRIGADLLEQGFVLLPILGVGPYLLARLLNISRTDDLPESRLLPSGWLPRAAFALTIGLTIDATFVAETFGWSTPAVWLRAGAVLAYLATRMPRRGRSFLGDCMRTGLGAVVLALAVDAVWPQYRLGALHILFHQRIQFHRSDGLDPRHFRAQRKCASLRTATDLFHRRGCAHFSRHDFPLRGRTGSRRAHHSPRCRRLLLDWGYADLDGEGASEGDGGRAGRLAVPMRIESPRRTMRRGVFCKYALHDMVSVAESNEMQKLPAFAGGFTTQRS